MYIINNIGGVNLKILKIILDDEGNEIEVTPQDGTLLVLTHDNKVLTQVSENPSINLDLLRRIIHKPE